MRGTADIVDGLRAEGYAVTRTYVAWALRDRHIPTPQRGPGNCLLWDDADVARLKSFLVRRNRGPADLRTQGDER